MNRPTGRGMTDRIDDWEKRRSGNMSDHYREVGMDQPHLRHKEEESDEKLRASDIIGDYRLLFLVMNQGWLVQNIRTKDVIWMRHSDLLKIKRDQQPAPEPQPIDHRAPLRK